MLYAKHERPDSSTPLFDIATDEEIKVAHPKCGTCKWMVNDDDYDSHACDNANGISIRRRLDPDLDYCRHHERKEPT